MQILFEILSISFGFKKLKGFLAVSPPSPIPPAASPTLEESTSCRSENQKEESEELQASQTGNDILEALKNLNRTLEQWEKRISEEKSSVSTPPSVE